MDSNANHHHVCNYTQQNINHYNENAKSFEDRPQAIQLASRLASAMLDIYDFDEDSTEVMDFACGTGLISRNLAPYCRRIIGVDISQAMVDEYNKHVHNQGIPPEEMKAVCVELKGIPGELDDQRFDAIVCAASYHHFASIEETTKILAYFLKPGGALLVADILLLPDDTDVFQGAHHIVAHVHGFDEATIRHTFLSAGLVDFEISEATKAKKHGHDVQFFLAKGIKPSDVPSAGTSELM